MSLNGHNLSLGIEGHDNFLDITGCLRINVNCLDDPFIKELSDIKPMSDRQWRNSVTQQMEAFPQEVHDGIVDLCSCLLKDFQELVTHEVEDSSPLDLIDGCLKAFDHVIPAFQECVILLYQFNELRSLHPGIELLTKDICAVLLHHYLTDARLFKPTLDSNGQLEEMEMSDATVSHLLGCLEFITSL